MLQTDTRVGLTSEEVIHRRRKYGLNQMKYVVPHPRLRARTVSPPGRSVRLGGFVQLGQPDANAAVQGGEGEPDSQVPWLLRWPYPVRHGGTLKIPGVCVSKRNIFFPHLPP